MIDPGTLYEDRLGYVVEGPDPNLQLVYNNVIATPFLPTQTAHSDGGSSSYSDSHVAVSNTNTGTSSGTSFDLRSTASTAILDHTASFAFANASNEYIAFFHVTSPQTFNASVSLSAQASLTVPVTSYEFLALTYLYDSTSQQLLYDNTYIYTYGQGSFYGIPASVSLLAGDEYSLVGETYAFAWMTISPDSPLGSISGMAAHSSA